MINTQFNFKSLLTAHAVVYSGGSVVVDSMFIVAFMFVGVLCFVIVFIQYFISLIGLQLF